MKISIFSLVRRVTRLALASIIVLWFVSCKKAAMPGETKLSTDNLQSVTLSAAGGNHNDSIVTICNQVWMVKNLDVSTYRDGTPIPRIDDYIAWDTIRFGAYCYYNNDSATYAAVYGKLYNWYAAGDTVHGGLAPLGWHVPSDEEWKTLAICVGGVAGIDQDVENFHGVGALKEKGFKHWKRPNAGATNTSGFTALPAGMRFYNPADFNWVGQFARFWTSTELNEDRALSRTLTNVDDILWSNGGDGKMAGYSVRCVKD
jgi:uncharacterized protein (TIGR02145 family)